LTRSSRNAKYRAMLAYKGQSNVRRLRLISQSPWNVFAHVNLFFISVSGILSTWAKDIPSSFLKTMHYTIGWDGNGTGERERGKGKLLAEKDDDQEDDNDAVIDCACRRCSCRTSHCVHLNHRPSSIAYYNEALTPMGGFLSCMYVRTRL
jgi:hypothetical protein